MRETGIAQIYTEAAVKVSFYSSLTDVLIVSLCYFLLTGISSIYPLVPTGSS